LNFNTKFVILSPLHAKNTNKTDKSIPSLLHKTPKA